MLWRDPVEPDNRGISNGFNDRIIYGAAPLRAENLIRRSHEITFLVRALVKSSRLEIQAPAEQRLIAVEGNLTFGGRKDKLFLVICTGTLEWTLEPVNSYTAQMPKNRSVFILTVYATLRGPEAARGTSARMTAFMSS